jgi:hypothetical protein
LLLLDGESVQNKLGLLLISQLACLMCWGVINVSQGKPCVCCGLLCFIVAFAVVLGCFWVCAGMWQHDNKHFDCGQEWLRSTANSPCLLSICVAGQVVCLLCFIVVFTVVVGCFRVCAGLW